MTTDRLGARTSARPSRWFTYGKGTWDPAWWRPLVRGTDEWCNQTLAIALPGKRAFVLCLNIPLRREPCGECQAQWGDLRWWEPGWVDPDDDEKEGTTDGG